MQSRQFFIFLCMTLACFSAPPIRAQYVFSTLTTRDGLSSKEVRCTYTDEEGFLWCATANGLNRWDGSRFQIITPYSKTVPGLPHESVTYLLGWRGKMWVGTQRGVAVLDKRAGRFRAVPCLWGRDTVPNADVYKLHATDDGTLWAATSRGLFFLDGPCMRPVSLRLPAAHRLDSTGCEVYPDGGRVLWVRSDTAIFYLDLAAGIYYDRFHNPRGWEIFNRSHLTTIAMADDGRVWFGTYYRRFGLFVLDKHTGAVTEHPSFKGIVVTYLHNDNRGQMWLATSMPAAFVVAQKSGALTRLQSGEGGLSYAAIRHIHTDAAGNLWIATANGISKLPAVQPLEAILPLPADTTESGARYSLVNSMQVADSGHLWICKDDGLYRFSLADRTYKHYRRVAGLHERENRFFDIRKIRGEWWCGNGDGINIFNPATGTFKPFTQYPKEQLPWRRSVMWMQEDREGCIWYASWLNGLYRYDPRTNKSIRMDDTVNGKARVGNWIFGFLDSGGRMWFEFAENGLRRWDAATRKMVNPIPPGPDREAFSTCIIYNMIADGSGGYWVSTDRMGAVQIDSSGHIIQRVSLEQGLHTTAALSVWLEPGGARLWIVTSEGIQRYETKRRLLSAIDMDFGIMVKDYGSVIVGMGNRAYVSTNGRLAIINIKAGQKSVAIPLPLITGVRVFEGERPLPPPDSALHLEHDENFFSIDFSSPLHRDAPALQYSYMLEGFDKDWVVCGRRQSAAYTNVPPGSYTFRVRTTNDTGEWQTSERSIRIRIGAPFWQQPWFTALWLAVLALIGYLLMRYIQHRKRRQRVAATIDYFANSVYGENSVADICWDISRNCISQMSLEDCVVYLRDDARPVMVQIAAYGPKAPAGNAIENPIEIPVGKGIVGTVAQTGKPILVQDTRVDSRYIVDDEARLSELAVPIIHDGEVIGVIDSEHSRRGFFNEVHLKALSTIASICANKIAEAKAEAAAEHKERELLQTKSLLADSQLMALRTQMNPHFVFNSLNSIQECIVTGKHGDASLYLNKFSKLFRALLENSSKPLITLAEEIEVLELYLQLEHMRFEGSFEYRVEADEDLETEEILIPSMLLQPFVENALWHGLMHKDGERSLTITFESLPGDLFRCTIDDNGIGRKKAAELKAARQSGKSHISRGMQITADRIALMQRRGQAASLNIIDKCDDAGEPAGTKVVLELSAYLTTLES